MKRWGVDFDGQTLFAQYRNRVRMAVDESVGQFLLSHPEVSREAYRYLGEALAPKSTTFPVPEIVLLNRKLDDDLLYIALGKADDLPRLASVLQALFWALEESSEAPITILAQAIRKAGKSSPGIGLQVVASGRKVTLCPAGVPELDRAVVDEVLSGLSVYPKAEKPYRKALGDYLAAKRDGHREVLDNLRCALEQLLRGVLRNSKQLEKQKPELLRWLKDRRVNQEAINMFATLVDQFSKYQNAVVKHDDRAAAGEVEFLIYLTGTFMRFLLEVEREFKAQLEIVSDIRDKTTRLPDDVALSAKQQKEDGRRQRARGKARRPGRCDRA
jgi:hypothetical protein